MAIRIRFKPKGKRKARPVVRGSRRALMLELLARREGVLLTEMSQLLGWNHAATYVSIRIDIHEHLGYGVARDTKTGCLFLRYPRRMTSILYR
jgi:hypothetical protein